MPEITIDAKDGSGEFSAYIAMPSHTPAPALVVIQEIFGVNAEMRKKCDEFAAQGYVAISPDLFWRLEPGVQLTDKTQEEWDKAFDLMGRFDVDKGIEDIAATIDAMRHHEDAGASVGAVGYCLGGKLAYLTAARTDADASVAYYGVQIDEMLDEAANIKKPLMLHIAEEDEFVPKDAQEKIKTGLEDHEMVTIHSYPGVSHAFARIGGENYDDYSATTANQRTKEFLAANLRA